MSGRGGNTNNKRDSGDTTVRVVLVGRSDSERALRRAEGIELIRAREAHQAIGEIAHPMAEDGAPTVVLVAPGAVERERAQAFAGSIRRLDPRARIVSLDDAAAPGFDSAVRSDSSDLARLLIGEASMPEPSTLNGAQSAGTADETPDLSLGAGPARPEELIGSLLRGADVIEQAMRGVRARLGIPNAAFVAAARSATSAASAPTGGVPVTFGDRTLGHLVAPRADRAAVEAEAAAIAPWAALAQQQEQLKRAAFTDELTGAWNRRYFTRFLAAAIEQARTVRHSVAVLYFDLDNFKLYNDHYGHAAGDEILVETVKLLRSVIRPSDRVCRIGGDEFAVIFYDPQGPRDPSRGQAPSDIGPIARRFQQQICRHRFPKLGDEAPGTLTISGGMAAFPWDGADVNTLLDKADQLALLSKKSGKNIITLGPGAERVCRLDE